VGAGFFFGFLSILRGPFSSQFGFDSSFAISAGALLGPL